MSAARTMPSEKVAGGSDFDTSKVIDVIDLLYDAVSMAAIAFNLTSQEITSDPNDPGRSYSLTDEQRHMIQLATSSTERMVRDALTKLEAAR